MVTLRTKFGSLQDISERYTLNDEYENFLTTNLKAAAAAAAVCIPTKQRYNILANNITMKLK